MIFFLLKKIVKLCHCAIIRISIYRNSEWWRHLLVRKLCPIFIFFVFGYDPDDPNPTRKTQLDYTPTQIGKTDSKMSHSKSGLLCKIVKWFRLAHFLVSVLQYISISFNTKEVWENLRKSYNRHLVAEKQPISFYV